MKQHITPEQLNELTDEQKEKLREWWNPQYGDMTNHDLTWGDDGDGKRGFWEEDKEIETAFTNGYVPCYPLLSIGQMIEFLDSLDLEVCISKPHLTQYEVAIYDKYTDKIQLNVDQGFYQGELCDALWEAVKELLTPQKE